MNSEYSDNFITGGKKTGLSRRNACIQSIIEQLRRLGAGQNIFDALEELLKDENGKIVFPDAEMKKDFLPAAKKIFSGSEGIQSNREEGLKILSILLQQQVEIFWYRNRQVYKNDKDILDDDSLIDLSSKNLPVKIFFNIKIEKAGLISRMIHYIEKKIRFSPNNPGSNTVGMKTTKCRIEVVSLLNEISCKIAELSGRDTCKIHINSILRSVDHQNHLSQLGYFAPAKSSHSTGYAVDIEKKWYRDNDSDVYHIIKDVISQYFINNIINIIDEGEVWHICLNPDSIDVYRKSAPDWAE